MKIKQYNIVTNQWDVTHDVRDICIEMSSGEYFDLNADPRGLRISTVDGVLLVLPQAANVVICMATRRLQLNSELEDS